MLRYVDIEEIWDGRFYGPDDAPRIGCDACAGCSVCCRTTGDSIVLDPYDMYMLQEATGKTFQDMIEKEIEIRLVDGMILPNIMEHDEAHPEKKDGCPFLGVDGRCTIYAHRPGFCRLFPLGRYYVDPAEDTKKSRESAEIPNRAADRTTAGAAGARGHGKTEKFEGGSDYRAGLQTEAGQHPGRHFRYFVQRDECTKKDAARSREKISRWIGIDNLPKYEDFIVRWHFFLKDVSAGMTLLSEQARDPIARYVLQMFYVAPYSTQMNFYAQFEMRLAKAKMVLAPLLDGRQAE